jgi:uncharacterized membrane protein YqhA
MAERNNKAGAAERFFEGFLWRSRLVVLVPVVASLLVGIAMVAVATADVVRLSGDMIAYVLPSGAHATHAADPAHAAEASHAASQSRADIIARIVEVIDGYLLATIMLIFAFGLYELFISRIDAAEESEFAQRVLLIRSFDDLKDRLAKVVLLVLVVKFFEHGLRMDFSGALDLLYLAVGIALIGVAITLTHKGAFAKGEKAEKAH